MWPYKGGFTVHDDINKHRDALRIINVNKTIHCELFNKKCARDPVM